MRSCIIFSLLLLFSFTLGDKKIHLEDVEQDNISQMKKSYSVKQEVDSDEYQSDPTSDYYYHQNAANGLGSYTTAKPINNNYHYEVNHDNLRYEDNDEGEKLQSYSGHNQQQIEIVPKSYSNYNHQDDQYEPEVSVGNQYQTLQQKAASQRFTSNGYKGTIYIPMNQLLAYYPHLSMGQVASTKSILQLATQAAQQIPIYPLDSVSHTSQYPSAKIAYQIQPQYITYASKYPLHTQATLSAKKEIGNLYSQKNHLKDIVYTPEVISQAQTQDVIQSPIYIQSHALNNYDHQTDKLQYILSAFKRLQSNHHQYQKSPQDPHDDLAPPQLPAQNFKSNQYSTSGESNFLQNHGHLSEPKSLLDSYVPSHIIIAKDEERYRERPIKLESGFLPSKINFIHSYKKRKTHDQSKLI